MPNYSLVTPRQSSISFDDMIRPYLLYDQKYNQIQEKLATLDMEAGEWEKLAQDAGSQQAYNTYKAYADELKSAADRLANNGLRGFQPSDLYRLSGQYSKIIKPMEENYKRYLALMDERRKQGAGTISDWDEGMTFDRFNANPLSNPRYINLDALTNKAATLYGTLAKTKSSIKQTGKIDDYNYTILKQAGYSPEEINKFVYDVVNGNDEQADAALKSIYDNLYNATGVDAWNSSKANEAVRSAILTGANGAIGQTEAGTMQDIGAIKAMERRTAMEAAGYKAALEYKYNKMAADADYEKKVNLIWEKAAADAAKKGGNLAGILGTPTIGGDTGGIGGGTAGAAAAYTSAPIMQKQQTMEGVLKDLGVNPNKNTSGPRKGLVNTGKVKVDGVKDTVSVFGPKNNGAILPEKDFVSQGKTTAEQASLKKYYEDKIKNPLTRLGLFQNGTANATRIVDNMNKLLNEMYIDKELKNENFGSLSYFPGYVQGEVSKSQLVKDKIINPDGKLNVSRFKDSQGNMYNPVTYNDGFQDNLYDVNYREFSKSALAADLKSRKSYEALNRQFKKEVPQAQLSYKQRINGDKKQIVASQTSLPTWEKWQKMSDADKLTYLAVERDAFHHNHKITKAQQEELKKLGITSQMSPTEISKFVSHHNTTQGSNVTTYRPVDINLKDWKEPTRIFKNNIRDMLNDSDRASLLKNQIFNVTPTGQRGSSIKSVTELYSDSGTSGAVRDMVGEIITGKAGLDKLQIGKMGPAVLSGHPDMFYVTTNSHTFLVHADLLGLSDLAKDIKAQVDALNSQYAHKAKDAIYYKKMDLIQKVAASAMQDLVQNGEKVESTTRSSKESAIQPYEGNYSNEDDLDLGI